MFLFRICGGNIKIWVYLLNTDFEELAKIKKQWSADIENAEFERF